MFNKKNFIIAFAITMVFMMGFMTSNIYADISGNTVVNTNGQNGVNTDNTQLPSNVNTIIIPEGRTDEVASPSSWIAEDKIGVYSKNVILDIEDPQWASFTDTHSMEPVLSSRSYAIEVVPKSVDQINVGDIVSYKSKYADGIIIHRVIEKKEDSQGVYFILKGDNNPSEDPGKIRFDQIQRVVVAIIY